MEYVYTLVNSTGTVEYVGQTARLDFRKREHLKYNKKSQFLGRTDLELVPVAEFNTRKEAYQHQCVLQKIYNIPTDKEVAAANGLKSRGFHTKVTCPHCGRTGQKAAMSVRHFEKCKHKNE